ncbi:ATP-binding protein [Desulfuromonas sp. KJ2020]|uniref:ATP-binding protein n=1 Tax=Desulfuromonas sp. KJ2020 TaxID=2919173 RepID=UPI003532049B
MGTTNPGLSLVKTDRFLDSPPKSRNEVLSPFTRRIGVCGERGSGVDRVVNSTNSLPHCLKPLTNKPGRFFFPIVNSGHG